MCRCFLALGIAVLMGAGAHAQIATTTALVGTVTDASGKTVPGAKVTAVNTGTLDAYNTTTNDQGYYNIQFIRVGTYNLTVEQPGFQKFEKTGIEVNLNAVVRNDVTLAVGSVTQSITIEATAPVIKTDDATVSETITTRDVADLPLNGRDPLRLATTTPGVIPGLKASNGVPPGEDFIGAGTREIQNSIALDGISIVNNLITTTPIRPMVESIQEVEVQTGTYSAQYGSYMGVHMNLVTKSGTNGLHGSVLEFLRNDALDARPFFLRPTSPKTPLRQNQFGFELDGPLVIPKLYNGRDKTFFMGSYEGLRQRRQSASLATLITPAMWEGNFSAAGIPAIKDPQTGQPFPGNIVPSNRLSPITQRLRQYYPVPTSSALTNNFAAVLPNNNDTDQTVDRLDQNLGNNVRLYFRYQEQNMNLLAGSANPVNASTSPVSDRNWTVGYTHTLTPRIVNDFRFGRQYFLTSTLNYFAASGIKDAGTKLGINGFDVDSKSDNPGLPDFNISGFTGFGNGGTNWYQDDKTWQASEQFSWNRGAHNIMAGAEFRKLITGRAAANSPRGIFNFNNTYTGYAPADFVLGLPQSVVTPSLQVRGLVAEWRDGFFVLDNWQVSRKLTVNYGIRYELPTVPYTVNGFATELNPEQTALVPPNPPKPGFKFIAPNHKDWAPRIGFAYRLTNKTVFRGGYGIYYNPNQTNTFTFLNTNPPFSTATTCTGSTATPNIPLANPTSGPACLAPAPNIITDAWHMPTAYMNQWSFGLERELWRNSGLEVQYLGSHSLHLDRSYFNNTPYFPGPGTIASRRPNPLFGQIRTIANDLIANYEGVSVVLRQRYSHGIQFLASYTWSHTLDVTTDSNGGGSMQNPYNWRADYGNSNWDIRHRFVASYVYDVPFFRGANSLLKNVFGNWQVNGITTLQSGLPFNVSVSGDPANTSSQGVQRPNLVHAPSANCGDGHLTGCIDRTAFALIPAGTFAYGNAGRNLLHGPHLLTTDFSLFKNFRFGERVKFQLRGEFFNVFNSPQFSNPAATFGTATFGNITSTSIENRDVQIGAKLGF